MATQIVKCSVSSDLDITPRVRQVSSMFDVPLRDKIEHSWRVGVDLDFDWSIGLIVGPSGSGKSTMAREMFGREIELDWRAKSVVDDFDEALRIQDVTDACSSVGFNTIPSWLKPFHVLSNGEKFRVTLARLMAQASAGDTIMVDEFTSVVDRQVARIGSHAVQKMIRRKKPGVRFVAVTCHEDVEEWLQPDWVLRPATETFARRSVQSRPGIEVEIRKVDHSEWRKFAPFHYMSADLNKAAQCYGLFIDDTICAFAGLLFFPHPKRKNIVRISRVVTLPDYQGMGLAFVLIDTLASAYKAIGLELRNYPAHPSFVRAHDRSRKWALRKKPGVIGNLSRTTKMVSSATRSRVFGRRPCAVFSWVGESMDEVDARRLLASGTFGR